MMTEYTREAKSCLHRTPLMNVCESNISGEMSTIRYAPELMSWMNVELDSLEGVEEVTRTLMSFGEQPPSNEELTVIAVSLN